MPAIGFPLSSAPGVRVQEGGGRLINAYAEQAGEGARGTVLWRSVPGLTVFAETEGESARGLFEYNNTVYAAYSGELYTINADGEATLLDEMPGTGPVFFARNNVTPVPDILAVSDGTTFVIGETDVTDLNDPDLPAAEDVTFLDGYFFWAIGDGRVFASGLNSTSVNALDFARAESRPGGLLRCIAYDGRLWLFGPQSIEVWYNTAEPEGFPLSRASVIDRGLISKLGVTGYETGFTRGLIFVADDDTVCEIIGYETRRISTHDLERLIEGVADKSTIQCMSYVSQGHPMIVVTCPEFTWVYDLVTRQWHERQSYMTSRWRARYAVSAFGGWLVQDRDSGNVLKIDADSRYEAGEPLVWEVESIEMHGFPRRIAVPRADFDFVVGVGDVQGLDPIVTAPQVAVSWSDDGGYTWSTPLLRSLGRQGQSTARVQVWRTGLTGPQGRRWRLSVSDPVYVSLLGGYMAVEGEDMAA